MTGPVFYFGAISPYSWFAAERIGALIADARWRPVFAGGLFRAAGRVTWGITEEREAKITDCERRAAAHGLGPIVWPDGWPAGDVLPARAMVVADREGRLEPFALTVMRACFVQGRDVTRPEVLTELGEEAGFDRLVDRCAAEDVKDELRAHNEAAIAAGVIGVPSVVIEGEVFWGDDRLEEAAATG